MNRRQLSRLVVSRTRRELEQALEASGLLDVAHLGLCITAVPRGDVRLAAVIISASNR
jgi:hypothetical protein